MAQWKQAVAMATSSSQLSVCMVQLERSIAWEKSLLKVVSPGNPLWYLRVFMKSDVCELVWRLVATCVGLMDERGLLSVFRVWHFTGEPFL